jgi:hypothetical protein
MVSNRPFIYSSKTFSDNAPELLLVTVNATGVDLSGNVSLLYGATLWLDARGLLGTP